MRKDVPVLLACVLLLAGACGKSRKAAEPREPFVQVALPRHIRAWETDVIVQTSGHGRRFSEDRAPVIVDGKWGYIDRSGHIVIKPRFDRACAFHEERAAVNVGGSPDTVGIFRGGKWGCIDTTGTFIVKPQAAWVDAFSEGLARVQTVGVRTFVTEGERPYIGSRWHFIDRTGQTVIPGPFKWAERFSEGRSAVRSSTSGPSSIQRARRSLPHGSRMPGTSTRASPVWKPTPAGPTSTPAAEHSPRRLLTTPGISPKDSPP